MKVTLIACAIFAVMGGVLIFTGLLVHHNNFTASFGVEAPWNMTQDEQGVLQPFVTKQLQELKKHMSVVRQEAVACADAECMAKKLAGFQAALKSLDDAIDVADNFGFDTSIPSLPAPKPTCDDGFEPNGGQCAGGYIPAGK